MLETQQNILLNKKTSNTTLNIKKNKKNLTIRPFVIPYWVLQMLNQVTNTVMSKCVIHILSVLLHY